MGEKPIQSMEISQYSIAGHRCHFTNKVERGGNAYMNRAYTQTPPFPVVVFPDLRVYACVCVHVSYLACITISSTLDSTSSLDGVARKIAR